MTEVQIPVSRREREGLIAGTIWCLPRSRAYGGPGDSFRVGETTFVITATETRPLGFVRDEYFSESGFGSPQEFAVHYRHEVSGGRRFNPYLQKVVHWVDWVRISGDRLLIWNDPERIGMDALDYCMGIQCPLRDCCKRYVIEAMKYPGQIKVKMLPTTPYDKKEEDCDYFIQK